MNAPRPQRDRFQGWFCTAAGGRWAWAPGGLRFEPVGTIHAKRMGTSLTACGVPTGSWKKFWDLAFAKAPGRGRDICPACTALLRSHDEPSRARSVRGRPSSLPA